jgi:DNA ligase-1
VNYKKKHGDIKFTERFKQLEEAINEAVCVFPNYTKMIEALLESGTDHVEMIPVKCYMRVGIPVKPMLAKPTNGIQVILKRFEGIKFTCEYKYDGFRGQIHYQKEDPNDPTQKKIGIFSRNLENMTQTYPDAIKYLTDNVSPDVKNFIIDCEIVPFDVVKKKILPFQVLTTRSRKNVSLEDVEIQVCLYVFDLLYLNDQSDIIKKTFKQRREIMKATLPEDEGRLMHAKSKDAEKFEEIEEFLTDSINDS